MASESIASDGNALASLREASASGVVLERIRVHNLSRRDTVVSHERDIHEVISFTFSFFLSFFLPSSFSLSFFPSCTDPPTPPPPPPQSIRQFLSQQFTSPWRNAVSCFLLSTSITLLVPVRRYPFCALLQIRYGVARLRVVIQSTGTFIAELATVDTGLAEGISSHPNHSPPSCPSLPSFPFIINRAKWK